MLRVQHAIQKVYGYEYKVENFGSTRYGVSVASSDLDMVILDPHRPHGAAPKSPRESEIYNVRVLAKVLKKAGFRIIETISAAAVPIVKFSDPATGHSVDLNVNERLGLLNSDLIKRYCELNPLLITMIQYIKLWAKPLGLNSPGRKSRGQGSVTFSSYALTMMTIGFMQHRGLLPNLQEGLPPLRPGKLTGTFWLGPPRPLCCDVRYNKMEGWKPPREVSVLELMQDWFYFWGSEFDYPNEMISIREGGRLQRPERGPGPYSLFNGTFWNIDPFIRVKNLTGNIDRASMYRFASTCLKFAEKPEFARGSLPQPKGWFADGQLSELDALMIPVGVQKAEWVQVDALPLPWREIPGEKARKNKVQSPPVDSTWWPEPEEGGSTASPPGLWSDPPAEESSLDRSFEVPEEPPPPFKNAELDVEPEAPPRPPPKATSGPGRPVELQDEGFEFDESIRIDAFGRIMEPKRPPKISLEEEEEEEDKVGFGLK
ncbi:hypothetical protein B0H16DRAFT_314715 [Mycena metata]|uniref:polynucleotide adenylyltransferase n=1 Tax=Mycena metata TaxID=1033252 RepID=A0AAD7JS45_9AGAR|nr:hypothetical protein B0H16DRAFT_314715 [Mycena metata]